MSGKAEALPQYSIKEQKRCVYCHVDPKGGGPTNSRGRYYGKHLSFEGYQGAQKKKSSKGSKKSDKTTIEVHFDD
jgi:hypothetical protein